MLVCLGTGLVGSETIWESSGKLALKSGRLSISRGGDILTCKVRKMGLHPIQPVSCLLIPLMLPESTAGWDQPRKMVCWASHGYCEYISCKYRCQIWNTDKVKPLFQTTEVCDLLSPSIPAVRSKSKAEFCHLRWAASNLVYKPADCLWPFVSCGLLRNM